MNKIIYNLQSECITSLGISCVGVLQIEKYGLAFIPFLSLVAYISREIL